MRESQNLLQTILDNLPITVFLRDRNGRFIMINKRYEEVELDEREEVIGRTLHEALPKDKADEFLASDVEVMRILNKNKSD